MFKIGEFSKLTQVSARMLRYYDETGLLKPAVVDSWTGYRMYSAKQIPVLNKIIYLRDSGFNRAEIAFALKQDNGNSILDQLDKNILKLWRISNICRLSLKNRYSEKKSCYGGKVRYITTSL